jgi:hypothetical protein
MIRPNDVCRAPHGWQLAFQIDHGIALPKEFGARGD